MVLFTIVEFYNEDDDINHHGFLRNVSQHKTKISKQGVDDAEIESNGKMVQIMSFSHVTFSTCGSLRGRPRSLLFDLGGRPLRLLSLLLEVNLLGTILWDTL